MLLKNVLKNVILKTHLNSLECCKEGITIMNKKVFKSFNEQVQAEFYSAYMYLAMSLDMEAKNYKGMAKWLYLQY